MLYTLNINQKELIKLTPDIKLSEATILQYLYFICTSKNTKVSEQRYENYTWINYETLLEDLPLLEGRTPATITPKINRLEAFGYIKTLIKKTKLGHTRKYVDITDLCDTLFRKLNEPVKKTKRAHLENLSNKYTKDNYTKDNIILSKSKDLQEIEKKSNNEINPIIDIFYQYSKNNRLFAMKCQRKAVEDLIKQFDVESVIKFAEFAISCNGKPYAPQITTPLQLQSKMGQLRAFYEQLKNKQTNTITKI